MRHFKLLLLILIGSFYLSIYSHYPYIAPQSLLFHRYERYHLFTADVDLMYGSCTQAHNHEKEKTNVLGIYNREQLHQVGKNIPNQDLTNLNTLITNALWHVVPTNDNYATLDFTGSFSSLYSHVTFAYNLTESFFIKTVLPFYKLDIKNPTYKDTTPTAASTVEWTTFLANFDAILSDASLSRAAYSKKGIGDVALALGWVRNVEELGQLFALDTIIQLGFLVGSAHEQDTTKVFSIAPGNNKHHALYFNFDTHIGANENITLSFHTEQTVFLKRNCTRRVKTALGQNGWIKLARTTVSEEWGNKYALGGYVTYHPHDYVAFSTGYTYYHQNKHTLIPTDGTRYSSSNINDDIMLKPWSMHTWHLSCEINRSNQDNIFHPRIALSYNRIMESHNTFLNHSASGTVGLTITHEF